MVAQRQGIGISEQGIADWRISELANERTGIREQGSVQLNIQEGLFGWTGLGPSGVSKIYESDADLNH